MLQNAIGAYWEKLTTGFKLGGGTTKRYLTVNGSSDTTVTGGATAYTKSFLNKNYLVGEQLSRGNGSYFDNGMIHGKAGLVVGTYQGNATARDIPCGFFPHFYGAKAVTAVLGNLGTYWGMSKASAVVNTAGNFMGVSSDGLGFKLGTTAGTNTNAVNYNYFAMCAHDGSLTGMKSASGISQAPSPAADRSISVTDFGKPDLVIVKGAAASSAVWKTSNDSVTVPPACSYFMIATADLATEGIQSLDANGFTLGTNAVVGTANAYYNWWMFKSDSSGTSDICLTTYAAIAGDGLHVDLPFQPTILFFIPAGANSVMMWNSSMAAGAASYVSAATANVADAVMSVDSYGFTLGANADLNVAGTTVNVIAIKSDY